MSNNHEIHKAEKREAAASNAQAVVADLEAKRASARLGSKRSAKIERRGNVLPRASARTAPESPEACLRSKPSVSAHPLTQVAGLHKGSRTHPQSGDIASVEAERDRELSAGGIAKGVNS
jgi:hypothetical protein